MLLILPLLLMILNPTEGQFQMEESHPKCGSRECVVISNCSALLQLVFQAKSGNQEAKTELLERQCGFERSLPKVCCEREGDAPTTLQPSIEKTKVEIPQACGQSSVGSNRVVHGEPARLNEWPWIAALGYKNLSTGQIVYRCGATLVTARHVVTAAHCVREDLTTVLLGEHEVGNDEDGANPEEFLISTITKHENFKSGSLDDDIAVVELKTAVVFKKGIQPVCLPSHTPRLLTEKFVSEGAYLAGWGRTSYHGQASSKLLQGILSVTSNQECREKYAGFANVDIISTKLCAVDRNDVYGACMGDSGGPLVVLEKADDHKYRYHLVGVVSAGYSKCHAVRGLPDVFTRLTEYDQWVRDIIAK